ncbi:Polyketide cyclase / dehydrase and lipid transport [Shewanella psychrophila]|uniref:Polyketide cyclase / dehydrase and lipid transport n=1 Tax=Shewanella psychrophila TaxID=225848 RepID=A0A1S6HWV1_9GAMM|nr:SRPBCC family protein [Shewanella psychrophila]AQS39989.1 Polyketide cyclase / dehydrase and lipid transport [Shewanella psychrophila]
MLKKFSIVVAVIIAIPFIAALFIKQEYSVITSMEINRPVNEVFEYVKHLKNQDNFSVWAQMDPTMEKTYKGVDGTVGFVSAWKSNNEQVGVGEQEIIKIDEGKRVDFELRFISPFEATEPAYMTTEAMGSDSTKVSWGFRGHLKYPMNLMFLFIDFETLIENDLSQGLDKLKLLLESDKSINTDIIEPIDH